VVNPAPEQDQAPGVGAWLLALRFVNAAELFYQELLARAG